MFKSKLRYQVIAIIINRELHKNFSRFVTGTSGFGSVKTRRISSQCWTGTTGNFFLFKILSVLFLLLSYLGLMQYFWTISLRIYGGQTAAQSGGTQLHFTQGCYLLCRIIFALPLTLPSCLCCLLSFFIHSHQIFLTLPPPPVPVMCHISV